MELVLKRSGFKIEIIKTTTVKKAEEWYGLKYETPYVYITKIGNNGEISRRSIGLPAADIPELIRILAIVGEPSPPRIKS